ncbi:neuron navigator [Plakobranchus ocellatus]|uniref:Neuron navigator n=1 Tax=Plakobranchus ocellatus TaxID=259542 RepID=A0AAV4DXU3_9GAST|nr:neuron navigator [Plakobranchus ocellatus]
MIYTDWANHYLEKARNKRHINDLQNDVADGVLLAEVIEAVSVVRPPSNCQTQLVPGIDSPSLVFSFCLPLTLSVVVMAYWLVNTL